MSFNIKMFKISVESTGYTAIDITNYIGNVVLNSKIDKGIAVVYTNEKGCSIVEIEYEPQLLSDLETLMKNLGCLDTNLCSVILGRSIFIPIISGKLFLGQFKNVVLIDTSKIPGEKSVVIALEGIFKDH